MHNLENLETFYNVHVRNDIERMRAVVLRRAMANTGIINDALTALSRNPPKLDIVQDMLERLQEQLREDVKEFQRVKDWS